MRIRITAILLLLLSVPALPVFAQDTASWDAAAERAYITSEMENYRAFAAAMLNAPAADENYDVTWYRLDLAIRENPNLISGTVKIRSKSVITGLSSIRIDLSDSLVIDSISDGSDTLSFTRTSNSVTVYLDGVLFAGDIFDINITYHGVPPPSGFGSFAFATTTQGAPWIWSLSQPYGAKDWWPCKDQLIDKADSSDVLVTCADTLRVGSNGTLAGVTNNGDGTATTHWRERYPIDTYLISIAISNYVQLSYWFHYGASDSMEVLNYVIPARQASAEVNLPRTVTMLGIYSDLFGLYPFAAEKYGHCDFNWGGAMEHQTMTSTGTYTETTIAHELGHQWFGDMITCGSWADLWLNEGFATYLAGLYYEGAYGFSTYYSYMTSKLANGKNAVGTLHVEDTTSVGNLFNGARVYDKGASVLHMLRHVLGDSLFFAGMYEYAHDPALRFGTAITPDFRRACETVSGLDLGYFFDEWVYGTMYPRYRFGWIGTADTSGYRVDFRVTQTTNTTNPAAFRMPVDVFIAGAGWDTTVVVVDSLGQQDFTFATPVPATSVRWDPGRWIMRDLDSVSYAVLDAREDGGYPAGPLLMQNYPNPFNPSTTIGFSLPARSRVTLRVSTVLGEEVAVIASGVRGPGSHQVSWDAGTQPAGVYFVELLVDPLDGTGSGARLVRKMLLLR
jgi:aminopeptidase N